jgi:hypothetical protein
MQSIVIGGHARNIGKTSVMCGLLRSLRHLDWAAVKITQYGHGICSLDGHECACAPDEHAFVLSEETDPAGRGDTSRFLAAGARRSLWLRVREGQLALAFPLLAKALQGEERVMMESNCVLQFVEPLLYLVVLNSSNCEFKSSARRFLGRASALVSVGPQFHADAWPGIDPREFRGQPLFSVSPSEYFSLDLGHFVSTHLSSPITLAIPQPGG